MLVCMDVCVCVCALMCFFFVFFLQTFECSTMEAYHDLYLQTDVYLLADVFEHFRKTAYKTYGLDQAHYLTLLGMFISLCCCPMHSLL